MQNARTTEASNDSAQNDQTEQKDNVNAEENSVQNEDPVTKKTEPKANKNSVQNEDLDRNKSQPNAKKIVCRIRMVVLPRNRKRETMIVIQVQVTVIQVAVRKLMASRRPVTNGIACRTRFQNGRMWSKHIHA